MNIHPRIFLTGASGMVGRDLVPYLLTHSDAELVLLCHRRGAGMDAASYLREVHDLPTTRRVRLMRGDIRRPDLGLAARDRELLRRSVTHVLHAAACTRFDKPLKAIRATNVVGTRHLLDLARGCRRLEQFGYVSTAYVSGRRTGLILEEELEHQAGFVNTYEQSKYEAEMLLAALQETLPIAIYRLSTVFGDSRTGEVRTMTAPHLAMKIIHHGLASIMPGLPGYRVDLIPGDFAASCVGRLFLDAFEAGRTYHLTANPNKSYALEDLVDGIFEVFGALDPEWSARQYPKPVFSSADAFTAFMDTAEHANNPLVHGVLRSIQHFAHQLTCPKVFDRSHVLRVMPGYDDEMPDIRQYFEKVIRYCVATRWGKCAA